MSFQFGDFKFICSKASLSLCTALGESDPSCYSRNLDIGGFLLFQPVVLLVAFVMSIIMTYHIRNKYTAVGRKEIVMFFYMYILAVVLDFFLISNIIPFNSSAFKIFAALQVSSTCTAFWLLLLNGFIGFQWAEDGTRLSVWGFRISSAVFFGISFIVSTGTFYGFLGSKDSAFLLFLLYIGFNLLAFIIYVLLQTFLVAMTLQDRWPLGDIAFGVLFFVTGVVLVFFTASAICEVMSHYLDGLFFGSIFILLAVMMVYKYWDSITKEDLEFCVGGAPNSWDLQGTVDEIQRVESSMSFSKYK